ncbi:MAG: Malonyl CoA-acyl carrier protein transacylase [Cyanobacteria bacterium RYN_339]|nr:Malonyl CoA-acyl carrier protein transacylase [Cyanobacteria bacterium RYN_339]
MSTLVARLRGHAASQGDRPALTYLGAGGAPESALTFAALDERVRGVAAALQARTQPGDRAVLLFSPGLDYAVAFLACLYAGVVAVPVYLPRGDRQLPRLQTVLDDATPVLALTNHATLARCGPALRAAIPTTLLLEDALAPDAWVDDRSAPLAFLQYTSGSTGAPRGVRISHANLMHNSQAIYDAFGHGPDSVALLWVPPYHDMGLIGGILQPVFGGFHGVLMSPLAFLKHPLGWLRAVERYGATTSGGPNFAYELCATKAPAVQGLDLSRWQLAFNGAEPVRAGTLERFADAFAPFGFRKEAFFPCYGLAEGTLIVSGGRPRTLAVDAAALERHEVAPGTDRLLVSAGHVTGNQRVTIEGGMVGEICVEGPSIAAGYWGQPDRVGPLRTGDLGFLHEGELFVTGRLKDLIIVDGRNFYPQDLEATAERVATVRPGGAAAFGVAGQDGERVVLMLEAAGSEVGGEVRRAIAAEHEVELADVVLVPAGGLPRTSSGKVRRGACREAYAAARA